jgi:hypothetical protein
MVSRQKRGLRDRRRPECCRGGYRVAKALTTTTVTQDVYAFIFGQEGLVAGLGLQGSKITKIER